MEKRFVLFIVLSFAILAANAWFVAWHRGPQPRAPKPPGADADAAVAQHEPAGDQQPADEPGDADLPVAADTDVLEVNPAEVNAAEVAADVDEPIAADADEPDVPSGEAPPAPPEVNTEYRTIGSVDPAGGYQMALTLTNKGAVVTDCELSDPRYRDLQHLHGYLGNLMPTDNPNGPGCVVRVVGAGTPAAAVGLEPGDVIKKFGAVEVVDAITLGDALTATRPGQQVELLIDRGGTPLTLTPTLTRVPMKVLHRELTDPSSFVLSLAKLDDLELPADEPEPRWGRLRTMNWEVTEHEDDKVTFRAQLPAEGLEILKRFRLAHVGDAKPQSAYHVALDVEIRNVGLQKRHVAYRLDGPTGLPTEGDWYMRKIGRSWGAAGMRDVAVSFYGETPTLIPTAKIADDDLPAPWHEQPLVFLGVDTQYFAGMMLPQKDKPTDIWLETSQPIRVGAVPADKKNRRMTNTSVRMTSLLTALDAQGGTLRHEYRVFLGPKDRDVLAQYGLDELLYYGWFGVVSGVMLSILHFFYAIVGNYGVSIIMLTVLVRLGLFPLSRRMALNAQRMQELQPEMKRIAEKYKNDLEKRGKAQQDLFRKHKYNPLAGCLPVFIQLPIFVGLYRGLAVDIELRGAPLFWQGFFWCRDLSAPDMLFRWDGFMPLMAVNWLGPYFNVLPLVTISLWIVQQKMFMPPATDEQTAMQQKIMQYMMIFMGVLFFRVPSGLCVYFIASTLWGITERKLLPRTAARRAAADGGSSPPDRGGSDDGGGGGDGGRPPRRERPRGGESRGNGAPRERRKQKKQRSRR